MGVTEKDVQLALKEVIDPELGINVVDLGLIYDVKVKKQESKINNIHIVMTLTTPGCPMGGWFVETIKNVVSEKMEIKRDEVMVEVVFDPPWSPELMDKEAMARLGMD